MTSALVVIAVIAAAAVPVALLAGISIGMAHTARLEEMARLAAVRRDAVRHEFCEQRAALRAAFFWVVSLGEPYADLVRELIAQAQAVPLPRKRRAVARPVPMWPGWQLDNERWDR